MLNLLFLNYICSFKNCLFFEWKNKLVWHNCATFTSLMLLVNLFFYDLSLFFSNLITIFYRGTIQKRTNWNSFAKKNRWNQYRNKNAIQHPWSENQARFQNWRSATNASFNWQLKFPFIFFSFPIPLFQFSKVCFIFFQIAAFPNCFSLPK